MTDLTRRTFTKQTLGSLLTYSLLETLWTEDAFGKEVKPIAAAWVKELHELGVDVKTQKVTQLDWQVKCEQLFAKVNLPELLKFIDFEKLTKNAPLRDHGARSFRYKFPEVEGLPKNIVFGKQIFGLKKGRSVVPHGHNNMATAFLMLEGSCHGKHYDRITDEKDHFIIRPTIDRAFKVGEFSSVSDHKDNIHWFKATSETAFIFNLHVLGVQPDSKLSTGRVYLDPNGEKLKDGLIRAPRISSKESHELYG